MSILRELHDASLVVSDSPSVARLLACATEEVSNASADAFRAAAQIENLAAAARLRGERAWAVDLCRLAARLRKVSAQLAE